MAGAALGAGFANAFTPAYLQSGQHFSQQQAALRAPELARRRSVAENTAAREAELSEFLTQASKDQDIAQQLLDLSPAAVAGPLAKQRNFVASFAKEFLGEPGSKVLDAIDKVLPGDVFPTNTDAGTLFEGLRAQFDLQVRALQKGPQTDSDAKVIASTTPELTDSRRVRESKARRFHATRELLIQRAEFALKRIDKGDTESEATRASIKKFPSLRFDADGFIIGEEKPGEPRQGIRPNLASFGFSPVAEGSGSSLGLANDPKTLDDSSLDSEIFREGRARGLSDEEIRRLLDGS